MANSGEIVDWALENGANGIEADLRFDAQGRPQEFHHGAPCDCSCKPGEICRQFGRGVCDARTGADELLSLLTNRRSLALVVIDSKIDEMTPQKAAGMNVVATIDGQLFERGYAGKVVLSTKEFGSGEFLRAAAIEVQKRGLSSKVFLAFGGEGNRVEQNIQRLIALPTQSRAFGAGASACWIGPYKSAIRLAEANRQAGVIGLTYTWTIDRRAAMCNYIDLGVGAIITNNPRRLTGLLRDRQIELAKPGSVIQKSTSDVVLTHTRRGKNNISP